MSDMLKNEDRVACRRHDCDTKGTTSEMEQVNGYWLCPKHAEPFQTEE